MSKEEAKGRVGLQNGGNTCFMNAALQCLLHAPELFFPFLDTDENPIEGQTNNKYKMVREFAKLVRNHYSTKSKFQSPQDFRKSLKNIASYLCDGDQHDSHELMNFVLQGLEEELNKFTKGEVRIENNFIPDYGYGDCISQAEIDTELSEKAKEWWTQYKSFNDCFITDALYGEICNRIQCTKCKKCAYNYSSFNTLYVPVKKSTVNITINLVIQYYDPDEDFIRVNVFAVPLSLKGSDMIKMIDIKLREQFRFSFQSFSDMPEPDLQEFAKQCRIVYVLRKKHASKGIMYSKLPLNQSISEFANAKSSSIFAYLVPPVAQSSTPVFFYLSALRGIRSNGRQSESILDTLSLQITTQCIPLLCSFPKTSSLQAVKERMSRIVLIAKDGRMSSNVSDHRPSNEYNTLYAPIDINAAYLMNSVFFDCKEEETEETEEGEVSTPTKDDSTTEVGEAENVEEPKDKENLKDEEEAEEVAPQVIHLPRFYATSMTTLSNIIQSIDLLPDITESPASDTIVDSWNAIESNSDYRAFLFCTSLINCTGVNTDFSFNHLKDRKKVCDLFMNCTLCEGALVNYHEEDNLKPAPVVWGKKKQAPKETPSQLTLKDCMELKKTTTVMLTGSSTCQHCHDSTTLETTPFLCRLPPILMVQLKRFKYSMSSGGRSRQSFGRQKIDVYVDFPVKDLDMSEYLLDGVREGIEDPSMMHYYLQGVVNHSGTADFGHYYAYCRDGYNGNDNWFEYNDSSVTPVREEEVVTKNAYVLLYRRGDLNNDIYTTISMMNIVAGKAKKGTEAADSGKVENEITLQRERSNGVDKERKEGSEENKLKQVIVDEKTTKKRLSKHERQMLKKKEKEMKMKLLFVCWNLTTFTSGYGIRHH